MNETRRLELAVMAAAVSGPAYAVPAIHEIDLFVADEGRLLIQVEAVEQLNRYVATYFPKP